MTKPNILESAFEMFIMERYDNDTASPESRETAKQLFMTGAQCAIRALDIAERDRGPEFVRSSAIVQLETEAIKGGSVMYDKQ